MEIIICLDDNNGMLFNNRRQSHWSKGFVFCFYHLYCRSHDPFRRGCYHP